MHSKLRQERGPLLVFTGLRGASLRTSSAAIRVTGDWRKIMLIIVKSVPPTQDSRVVIACIRACVWAGIEGRPFCTLR